jgi:hypothetical protein
MSIPEKVESVEVGVLMEKRNQIACFKAPLPRGYSTALLALLHCEFWAVFTRVGAAARAATLYDFALTLKHAIWWLLLQFQLLQYCSCYPVWLAINLPSSIHNYSDSGFTFQIYIAQFLTHHQLKNNFVQFYSHVPLLNDLWKQTTCWSRIWVYHGGEYEDGCLLGSSAVY